MNSDETTFGNCIEPLDIDDKGVIIARKELESVKKHWSTTKNGSLLARATSVVFRMIIAPRREGSLVAILHSILH